MPPESPYLPHPRYYSPGKEWYLDQYKEAKKAIHRKFDKEIFGVLDYNSSINQYTFRKIIETASKTNMWVDTWLSGKHQTIYKIMVDKEMQEVWWNGLEPPPEGVYHVIVSPFGMVNSISPSSVNLIDRFTSAEDTITCVVQGISWGPGNKLSLATTAGNLHILPPVIYTGPLDKGSWVEVSSDQNTMTTTITDLTRNRR